MRVFDRFKKNYDDDWNESDSNKFFAPLVLGALALLAFGFMMGRLTESSDSAAAVSTTTTTPGQTGEYPKTQNGAVRFTRMLTTDLANELRPLNDEEYNERIGELLATNSTQQTRVRFADKEDVADDAFYINTPLRYQSSELIEGKARVRIWMVSVVAGEEANGAAQRWLTHDLTVQWRFGRWKLVDWATEDGPTPSTLAPRLPDGTFDYTTYAELSEFVNSSKEFDDATTP